MVIKETLIKPQRFGAVKWHGYMKVSNTRRHFGASSMQLGPIEIFYHPRDPPSMHDGSTRNNESGVDLVGQLFNMYVHVQHFSSIIGTLTGECGDSRYCQNTSCREIGDGVAIEPASFFHTHIRKRKKERKRKKNSRRKTIQEH